MLRLTAAVLWAVLIGDVTVRAAPAGSAADQRVIAACVEADRGDGGLGGRCIGRVADPCIKAAAATDAAVPASRSCAERELVVWQSRLTTVLAAIKAHGNARIQAAVRKAEASATASRQALCPLFTRLDPGMALGQDRYCELQALAARVLLLERLAEALAEH